MSLEQTACEGTFYVLHLSSSNILRKHTVYARFFLLDLKAFERRLTEVIQSIQPSTIRWRSMSTTYYLILYKILKNYYLKDVKMFPFIFIQVTCITIYITKYFICVCGPFSSFGPHLDLHCCWCLAMVGGP